MTQEEKQLLLIDLCARLPYDLKGRVYAETTNGEYDINGDMIFFNSPFDVTLDDINTSTEEIHVIAIGNEETVDFIEDQQVDGKPYTIDEFKPYLRSIHKLTNKELEELEFLTDDDYVDYCNKHHIDYRNLIPKGLAFEAKEGIYEVE